MTQPLSKQNLLWTESGERRSGPVAEVALDTPVDRTYSYGIPSELGQSVLPGTRVVVPFGRRNRTRTGFVLSLDRQVWESTLKSIVEVLDPAPLLTDPLLELARWISSYTFCPMGRTLVAMLPEAVRSRSGFRRHRFVRPAAPSTGRIESASRLSAKRRLVLESFSCDDAPVEIRELAERTGVTVATIAKMIQADLLSVEERLLPAPAPNFDLPQVRPDFELNADQADAVSRLQRWIEPPIFRVGLLFGVSGSGKTEVYIRLIQRCLDAGRQAIVLVPEIALTTQAAPRLAQRFSDVAVLHSGLTAREKSLTWNAIAAGDKRVVIGTRSAIFAPCPRLGLIVVDEEQEASFKNQQVPRYHARDVAIKRAQIQAIPILLGSATPSLETWLNGKRLPHFEVVRLPVRVSDLPLPTVHLIDMRTESHERKGLHLMSRMMERKLSEALQRNEQAVLLLNRRGFATFLFCPKCRQRITCPRCGVNMVYHKPADRAICHTCGSRTPIPRNCPDVTCSGRLARFGMGTQRIEEELKIKFPDARVERADSDTMQRPSDYRGLVTRFENRQFDVLVGTQMIAKGLDFPFVSFVGVISADTALAIPDFRAGERTFQLVTQVAGRAGRSVQVAGKNPGQVVVQSLSPDLPAIQAAVRQDFELFAEDELAMRSQLGLPPFARLVRLILSDPRETKLESESAALAERIRTQLADPDLHVRISGPTRCTLARIRDLYRRQILISMSDISRRSEIAAILRSEKLLSARVKRLTVDPDPVSLL